MSMEEEENNDDATTIAFKMLQDVQLGNEIGLLRWCHTMDLLALSFSNNQVHIIRPSNLQRLHIVHPSQLSTQNSSKVSSIDDLCWSADGLLLAIASSSVESNRHAIDLLDLESGQIVFSTEIVSKRYCKLYWMNHEQMIDNVQSMLDRRTSQLDYSLRPLVVLPEFASLVNASTKVQADMLHHALLRPMNSFHVLIALSEDRSLDFFAMGTMLIFSIDLSVLLSDGDEITNISVLKDLSHIVVCLENEMRESRVLTISLSSMLQRDSALDFTSAYNHFIHAHDILCDDILLKSSETQESSKIGRCLHVMHTIWEQLFKKQFLPLFDELNNNIVREDLLVQNNDPSDNINNALITLLVAGTVDHPTLQWLSINANDQNLTKLVRSLRQVHQALTTYIIDYLQGYVENLIVRFSNLFLGDSKLVQICQTLYSQCQQTLKQSNILFQQLDHLLEFIRHAQLRICGKSKTSQRLQQLNQFVPLPLRPYDVKQVTSCLRSPWMSDQLSDMLKQLQSQYSQLKEAYAAALSLRVNERSSNLAKHIFPTARQQPVFQGQVLSIQSSTKMCTLVQLMETDQGEQYLHLTKIEPIGSPSTTTICIPDGFSIEFCNIYDDDQLFCLLRSQAEDTAGQMAMVTCSYSDCTWTTNATDAEEMQITKHRLLEKGELRGVDIVGGKVRMGCIVTNVDDKPGSNICIFDMEDDE